IRLGRVQTLRGERQGTFVNMLGRDPVRAALFALGLGPSADRFTTMAQQLGETLAPLEGAGARRTTTEAAFSRLLGKDINLGEFGVTGLGAPEQAATALQRGTGSARQLLASAFGVGTLAGAPGAAQPGITAEELLERIQAVTPKGVLP
ncbi:hypothetical protein LCGC14_2387810, partial [marine sediment metagenome]